MRACAERRCTTGERSPASNCCIASEKASSIWVGYVLPAKPRPPSGTRYSRPNQLERLTQSFGHAENLHQNRFGFFRIAVLGALATSIGLVFAESAESLRTMHLVYGLLIGGIGQGAFFGPLTVAVGQWFNRQRALAIAVIACGQSVGGLVVPPIMRWGVEQIGWQAMLTCYGLLAGTSLTACAFVFRRPPQEDAPQHASLEILEMRGSNSSLAILVLGTGMALSNRASFIVIAHMTAFGEEREFAPAAAGVSAMLGVTLLSWLLAGYLSARWGSYRVLVAMSLLLAIGTTSLALAHGAVAIGVAAIVIGLAFGGYLPGYAILVREIFLAAQAGHRIAGIYFSRSWRPVSAAGLAAGPVI